MVKTKSTAALPLHRSGDSTWVFTVYNLLDPRGNVRLALSAKLDHYPTPPHLVSDCSGRT